jgi:anti-sigma factor RsiW
MSAIDPQRHDDPVERELDAALARLPKHRAPEALRARIEAAAAGERAPEASPVRPRRGRVLAVAGFVLVAAAAVVALGVARAPSAPDPMVVEAVNDYVRVTLSEHPLEVASNGIHNVKPWFEGRVDFAPVVPFAGDDDFPLQGGAVAYFVDRKAATFVFKRRLHVVTLFVFRADGLPWRLAPGEGQRVGHVTAKVETSRGFHTVLWRDGDLGYALVSDVDPRDLTELASKIAP